MLSHVSGRRIGEWVLRVISMTVLVVIAMRSWARTDRSASLESIAQGDIAASLPRWSVAPPSRIHLALDSIPPGAQRDWLSALRRSGTSVTWNSATVLPLAVASTRLADPVHIYELAASAPKGTVLVVHDDVGVLDSAKSGTGGIRLEIPGVASRVGVAAAGSMAWSAPADSITLKRLLIEGAASWETKFTIAALAERGWKIDALSHVAPGVDVRVGNPALPDTARYAVLIAVDSNATLIARGAGAFVRNGGGLITLHDASGIGPTGATPVVLEHRSDGDVRAFTVGEGRVLRVGYKDLWRQRMSSDDSTADPVAAHRAWLARAVASVAYAPRVAVAESAAGDPAPLADLVDRLGPHSGSVDRASPLQREVPSGVLLAIMIAAMLLELTSRRLRGAR